MIRRPRVAPQESLQYISMEMFEKLKSIVECPICRCLMQSPVYVKPCMHKFCNECITHYYTKVYRHEARLVFARKPQCPSCRAPIGSRRYISPDAFLENLINRVFPNKQAVERHEDEEVKLILQNLRLPKVHEEEDNKLEEESPVRSSKRSRSRMEGSSSEEALAPRKHRTHEGEGRSGEFH